MEGGEDEEEEEGGIRALSHHEVFSDNIKRPLWEVNTAAMTFHPDHLMGPISFGGFLSVLLGSSGFFLVLVDSSGPRYAEKVRKEKRNQARIAFLFHCVSLRSAIFVRVSSYFFWSNLFL